MPVICGVVEQMVGGWPRRSAGHPRMECFAQALVDEFFRILVGRPKVRCDLSCGCPLKVVQTQDDPATRRQALDDLADAHLAQKRLVVRGRLRGHFNGLYA
jgi:hypothetical protein